MMKVPFVDLKTQCERIKPEIDNAINSVIQEAAFIKGIYVQEFEGAFAQSLGIKNCIGVGNGTDALYITLKALGIGPGDEVITAANSWISTSEAVTQTGARPVFVDIEPHYYTLDASQLEQKITSQTKAIIPVHLYGQSADIEKIQQIAHDHHLYVIEDCAQAHFSEYKGQKLGTFGSAGTFSFYPTKNLGAYGDGGAIVTNNDALAQKIQKFSNYGALKKHHYEFEGINSRLDGLQAAILNVKLNHLEGWNTERQELAETYDSFLEKVEGVEIPQLRSQATHTFHLYVIRTPHRDALKDYLSGKGVQTEIHYPQALPLMSVYRYLGYSPDDFPVAFAQQSQILSLPMYPTLTVEQVKYVCGCIAEFMATKEVCVGIVKDEEIYG